MATENAKAVEAILMVAEQPVEPQLLAQLLEINLEAVEALLAELMASYEVEDRGFILTKVAGGYRYQSHPDLAPYVERFVLEGQTARLSAAALETLAIIAYKQPLSRAQVGAIRGVNVDGVIRTLEQRGYIAEVARDPGPGNPILFGTTDVFLEKLGINSVDDLPPIAAFVPGPDVVEQLEHGLRAEIDLAVEVAEAAMREPVDPDAASDEEPNASSDTIQVTDTVEVVETDDGVEVIETIDTIDVIETDDGVEVIETIDTIEVIQTDDGVDVIETIEIIEGDAHDDPDAPDDDRPGDGPEPPAGPTPA
jgi:segregation and condensation protein B